MILNAKQFIFSAFFIFLSFFILTLPVLANEGFNDSLKEAGKESGYSFVSPDESANRISSVIGNTIKILLDLVGVIFIVLIIHAGYTWMIARGDEAEAQKAKNTITRAIIGLFIVLAAYAITTFIGNSF